MSNNSDMVKLLTLMESAPPKFAGEPAQKPGDQVRGTDVAKTGGKDHPFKNRLVGEDTTLEDTLSKKYQDFKDVHAKDAAKKKDKAELDEADYDDEDDYDDDYDEDKANGFFVCIGSEEGGGFVGMVTKDGGRWRETKIAGNAPYNWGGGYMSYLTPDDVMQHIRNDYRRSDVEGPFYDQEEAMEYARMQYGLGDNIGIDEGMGSDSPAAQAITRRILLQRTDLLSKYGPEKVTQAIDEVADFIGDVEEIGSSDVSGWIRHVEQMLGNMEEGVAEGDNPAFARNANGMSIANDPKKCFNLGYNAAKFGKTQQDCPYKPGSSSAKNWIAGWTNGKESGPLQNSVAEGEYPEVDHMPGPTIKRTQTGCKRCHGKGFVYKTPDGEVHPMNRKDAKTYKCGKCGGIGFVKVAEDAVDDFLARGGQIQQGKFREPRKSDRTDYSSRHIGGMRDAVAGKRGKTLGKAAATNFMRGGKAVVGEQDGNPTDTVTLDIPLFIRMMEYAREDAKSDMDLHSVTERMIKLASSGETLSMDSYDSIVGMQNEQQVNEFGADGSAVGSVAQAKQMTVATKPAAGAANAAPTASPTTSTVRPGTQDMQPGEQDALDKIKTNAGLKTQYDQLLQKAKTSV